MVTGAFALTRSAAYASGLRFDASPLETFFQYIDPTLLKERLLQSLFYLHSQPPLFNLELGLTLKAFPDRFALAMHVEFLAWGLVAALALYTLLVQLRVPTWTAAVVTTIYSSLPMMIVYENWLFYEYPTMALLLLSGVALHRFVSSNSVSAGVLFFLLLAAVILMRSLFQVIWLIVIVAMLCVVRPRRQVLAAAAVPFVVVLLLYGKNALLFGAPTSSSWFGMNLARMTVIRLDDTERDRLVRDGTLHRVSSIRPFWRADDYVPLVTMPAPTGVPVLDRLYKSDGSVNFNAKLFLAVSREYLEDSIWVIRHHPKIYRNYVFEAATRFFGSPTAMDFSVKNRRRIQPYDDFVSRYVFLYPLGWREMSPVLACAYLAAGLYGVVLVASVARRRSASPETITMLFLLTTTTYVFAVTSLTEIGENNRMRLLVEPLVVASIGGAIYRMTSSVRAWR